MPGLNSISNHQAEPAAGPGRIGDRILARGQGRPAYACRLATSAADIEAAQRLRFAVFNLELHEGLAQSFVTGRDADPFDAVCDHLLVSDQESGVVVGTYRLQTGRQAAARLGY